MIHTLRKLAREIHRRSVWQVLAAHLTLSVAVLGLVHVLTPVVGLPLWTPEMALALLTIGLPLVLITALVQGGLPGLRIVDVVDPNALEGRSPEEVHVVPEAHPLYGAGILTWRNAVLAGVMGAALMVTSVVAYLAMWAFGIGPVGSLAAQGIIAPQDTVVVVDFENGTDDPTLGSAVRSMFEAELDRSTLVNVLRWDTRDSAPALPAGAGAPGPVDLARAGAARLVISGEVVAVGDGYRLYARILLPDGTVLAVFGRTASGRDDLTEQVHRLSVRLRERLGESLRDIQAEES